MGVSTDGILAFGIELGEEGKFWLPRDEDGDIIYNEDEDEDEELDFETWWEEQNGVSQKAIWAEYYAWEKDNKTGDYEHDNGLVAKYEKLNPNWRKRLNNYYDEARRVAKDCPVELVWHCSYDYPMYILAVKDASFSASRGNPEEIDPENLHISEEALDEFTSFCEEHKIEGTPKWWLASMWG